MGLIPRPTHIICILLLFVVAGSGCATGRTPLSRPAGVAVHALETGDVFLPDGDKVSQSEFAALAQEADFILIGEVHTSECDHIMQAKLIEATAKHFPPGRMPVVGFEMIGADRQPVLDRFNADPQSFETPEDLAEALNWQENWGYSFELYRPIFEVAFTYNIPLYALNVPPAVMKKYRTQGFDALEPAEAAHIPGLVLPPSDEQYRSLKQSFEQHMKMMNTDEDDIRPALERFRRVQSVWDTAMAGNALQVWEQTGRPVVLLAGGGHVEHGWGPAYRLKTMAPGTRVLSVMPRRGSGPAADRVAEVYFHCPLTHASRLGFTLEQTEAGIQVLDVVDGSRAAKAGVKPGDIIIRAGDEPAESLSDLHAQGFKAAREKTPLKLRVRRGADELDLLIHLRKDNDAGTPRS